jgi:hypothetical protein
VKIDVNFERKLVRYAGESGIWQVHGNLELCVTDGLVANWKSPDRSVAVVLKSETDTGIATDTSARV